MRVPAESEEGFRFLWAGVIGVCELPVVGVRNRTWVFCKSSICLTAEPPLFHLECFN